MCYTVVLSSLLDPLYVSCFNVPVCAHSMLLEAAGERDREYLSLTVLVVELMYLWLGTDLIPEVVGIPEVVAMSCKFGEVGGHVNAKPSPRRKLDLSCLALDT